jgi:hypothetical protein
MQRADCDALPRPCPRHRCRYSLACVDECGAWHYPELRGEQWSCCLDVCDQLGPLEPDEIEVLLWIPCGGGQGWIDRSLRRAQKNIKRRLKMAEKKRLVLDESRAKLFGRSRRMLKIEIDGMASGAPVVLSGKSCKCGDYIDLDTAEIVDAGALAAAGWQPLTDDGVPEIEVGHA